MKIIKVSSEGPTGELIEEVVATLNRGGIIIYPTETAYGLGAAALNCDAIGKIFRIKGRDDRKPMSLMVDGLAMAEQYAELNEAARKLFSTLLPGPLTLVLRKRNNVPDILTGGGVTLGLRYPDYPLVLRLLEQCGFPFTATSLNPAGDSPLYDVSALASKFQAAPLALIDLVLDAGALPLRAPSTVLDLTVSPARILRPGPVTVTQLEKALGQLIVS